MATLTPTQNSADVESQKAGGQAGGQAGGGKQSGTWSIPGYFFIGSRRIAISEIRVNNVSIHPNNTGGIRLKHNDRVTFIGSGLEIYNKAGFLGEGSGASLENILIASESGGSILSFTVPDFDNSIKDGGYFWLKLFSKVPGAEKVIAPYLVYGVEETDEQKRQKKISEEEEKIKNQLSRATLGPTGVILGSMEEAISGIGRAMAGSGNKPQAPSGPGATTPSRGAPVLGGKEGGVEDKSAGVTPSFVLAGQADDDSDIDEDDFEPAGEPEKPAEAFAATSRQSGETVADFLRENSQISIGPKVLAALQSGKLENLTEAEKVSLDSVVKSLAAGQGGAPLEVMAAAQRVIESQLSLAETESEIKTGDQTIDEVINQSVVQTEIKSPASETEVGANITSQTSGSVSSTAEVGGSPTLQSSGAVGGTVKVDGGATSQMSGTVEKTVSSEAGVTAEGSVKAEGESKISGQQQVSAGGSVSSETEIKAKSETEITAQGSAKVEAASGSSVSSEAEESLKVGATTNAEEKVSGSEGGEGEKTPVSGELGTEPDKVSPQEASAEGKLTADIETNLESTQEPETGGDSDNLEEPQPSLGKGAVDRISVVKETAGQPEEEAASEIKATADVSKQSQAATKPSAKSETEKKQPQTGGGASDIAKRLKERGLELEMTLRGKLAGPSLNVSDQKQKPGGEQKNDGAQNQQEPVRSKTGPSSERGMSAPLGDLPRSNRQDGQESAGRAIDSANRPQEPSAGNGKKSQAQAQDQAPGTSSGDVGSGLPASPLEKGETRDLESSSGVALPPSESNRDRGNVFKDPRSAGDMFGEALKGDVGPNPAAYPAARRQIDLAGKGVGKASSKIWYYGFGSATATFFTGADFMLGAVVMDAYWLFGHKKNPELFPLKGWQKAVTIAANLIPPILITILIYIILLVGCNWPVPAKYSKIVDYRVTVIGAFIGDDCKYFDVSNMAASNTSAASTQSGSQKP